MKNLTAPGYKWRSHQQHRERFNEPCVVTFIAGTDRIVARFSDGTEIAAYKGQIRRNYVTEQRPENHRG